MDNISSMLVKKLIVLLITATIIGLLATKGIIYCVKELFGLDWYGKFWTVYLFVFLLNLLKGNCNTK